MNFIYNSIAFSLSGLTLKTTSVFLGLRPNPSPPLVDGWSDVILWYKRKHLNR